MSKQNVARPVKLQLNNSGAWKDVARFDAGNEITNWTMLDAANTIGQINTGRMTFRVVSDEALPIVLMAWNKAEGWKKSEAWS